MKVFGSIKDKAGSAGKKVLDVTSWIVMFIAIMAVVGIGGFIITAVVVNYQTLWAMFSDGASQILSDHWGLIILINALVIGGVTIFFISNDKKGVFNWEKVAMILLVIIFFVLRIKAEKKSGGSHA